jgi:DNA processing protein
MDEKAALLALILGNPHHWATVTSAVEERGSALAVLGAPPMGQQELLSDGSADVGHDLEVAATYIQQWREEGIHFATLLDPEYPAQLLSIHQRPPFVTWRGEQSPSDWEGVAIVGTRHPSPDGIRIADYLARDFARRGVTVVSGLAAGIDAAAHSGALDEGGRTVAVIGTGLRRSYPRSNATLQRAIGISGMVLSQFLPDSPPSRISFPMRNAIMSGFASATIVVEASEKSGARMQARLALQHGRPVFLMDQLREREWARGIAERPGARFVSSADEIAVILDRRNSRADQLIDL